MTEVPLDYWKLREARAKRDAAAEIVFELQRLQRDYIEGTPGRDLIRAEVDRMTTVVVSAYALAAATIESRIRAAEGSTDRFEQYLLTKHPTGRTRP